MAVFDPTKGFKGFLDPAGIDSDQIWARTDQPRRNSLPKLHFSAFFLHMRMPYSYGIYICNMHMAYAYAIWHMHMAYGICIWHMHMQETQNAEKYSFGNESGLGGPVLAQIWSESIPAGSRKPLKPLAGPKMGIIKKKQNPNSQVFPIFPIFQIFPVWCRALGLFVFLRICSYFMFPCMFFFFLHFYVGQI